MKKPKTPPKPTRVQLHPATDHWMRGDRYATIQTRYTNGKTLVRMDKSRRLVLLRPSDIAEVFFGV